MKNKIFHFLTKHNYVFGVISNILPLIGLIVMWIIVKHFSYLNLYQLWAWIAGVIYYIFMYSIALSLWNNVRKNEKQSTDYDNKIKSLEKRIKELEKK